MIEKELLLASTEAYLKSLISEVAELVIEDKSKLTPFQELGIDSFRVLQIIRKLEEEFGTLPKTLLFENFNISDLSQYFVSNHEQIISSKFAPSSSTKADIVANPIPKFANELSEARPSLVKEQEIALYPELEKLVNELFTQYKNEGSSSRGTRNIAPYLFIGSEKRGYFNYNQHKNIVLVYAYTGPKDYFPILAEEIYRYCVENNFELNLFTSEQIRSIGSVSFSATPFGILSRIADLENFSLEGSAMRRLRYQVSKFSKAGNCRTEEYNNGSDKDVDQLIAKIIDQWCAPRTMVNPLIYAVKEDILAGTLSSEHRLFLTYIDENLYNVILISKLSSEENGYLMDLEFYLPEMPLGGLEFAIVNIIEILSAEGCSMLSLGGTYGCKLISSSNADAALEKTLDYLRAQNIFNDEGNLQFKNKFRPEHSTVYLCRPVESNPDNIIDIIMMIADPQKTQTFDQSQGPSIPHEQTSYVAAANERRNTSNPIAEIDLQSESQQTEIREVFIEGEERSISLSDAGYNPINLPDELIEFDLITDSWAQLNMPSIKEQLKSLRMQLAQPVDLDEGIKRVFPFPHIALTTSGRMAEYAFFKSWSKKGIILQNLLFPTTIFHQIENGFTPRELPHTEVFQISSKERYKGNLDWDTFQRDIAQNRESIAFVLIELNDNAAGGAAVSLDHLREVKALLSKHNIPLVFDGTRVLENAQMIVKNDPRPEGRNVWDVAAEIFSYADAVIASLAKDFCVNKGGVIATRDTSFFTKIIDIIEKESLGLDIIDKKLIALSFQNLNKIETRVLHRINSVELLWSALKGRGIPVIHPAGGHCILIDVKQIPLFNTFEHPVASFLAWLFLDSGIRAGAHNVGMQKNTSINNLVRLAIPVGLKNNEIKIIIDRLTSLFEKMVNIPELLTEGTSSIGNIRTKFKLKEYHNISGKLTTSVSKTATCTDKQNDHIEKAGKMVSSVNKNADERAKVHQPKDIAIVGIAGRYPKAKNLRELWTNLVQGSDCIEVIPDDRFNQRSQNEFSVKYRGGFIDDIDRFDSLFFNISPREAEHLDPQERLFLEVAWEAIEDAGYYPETLVEPGEARNIGVFVGAVWTLYQMLGVEEKFYGNNLNPSSHLWSIANRVSYVFNLTGPSITIDTACSSSLTAIHLACESISNGQCRGAIVGGVNLDVHQSKININSEGGALSKDGVCRAFGKGANGYVAGEGVGAVFLKPLAEAVASGDNIYGVIKGTAINHGGKTSGFMVPSPRAQAHVISAALENAKVDARRVGYIETHGTGTELGDPIEISGLSTAFQKHQLAIQSCAIGSVKTNIGHLEAAAGIVGIHKVLLQMKHGKLVPSLHANELNPFIDFENSPFYVEQTVKEWQPKLIDGAKQPLLAGVSSFGAGGANAHVILEKYSAATLNEKIEGPEFKNRIFPLSARNEDQLRMAARQLSKFIQDDLSCEEPLLQPGLKDIAHTLQVGRKSFDYRLAIIAKTKDELLDKLGLYLDDKKDESVLFGQEKNSESITKMLTRQEKEEFIKLLAKSGDLRKIAQLWIDGLLPDWQGMGVLEEGKKVSLPTYPFADKRHWIADKSKRESRRQQMANSIHPLIDSNESTFERQIFKKTFRHSEFFLCDHLVSEIPTLPGVAYLDFARKAAELAAGRKVQKIKNILWLSPLTVLVSKPTEAFIELKPVGDLIHFEVFSTNENDQKQLHSQGKISYATTEELATEPEFIDLENIRARCTKVIDGKDAYPYFKSLGLHLGPSFQVLDEVFQNGDEILGLLKLPTIRQNDFHEFLLHPSLIDGTGQTGMAAQLAPNNNAGKGEMFVPYSFGEVEILHPMPATCFAYVKKVSDTNAKITKSNILVVDEKGKIVVKIKDSVGVPLVSVHEKPSPEPHVDHFSKLYYKPLWEQSFLIKENIRNSADTIIFFDANEELSDLYKTDLKALKRNDEQIINVKLGANYQDLGEQRYTVNPLNPEDFIQLFTTLNETHSSVCKICFISPTDQPAAKSYTDEILKKSLEKGIYPFLHLCQALTKHNYQHQIQLLYLYLSPDETQQAHHDAMDGFVKTLHIEHPKLIGSVVEIQQDQPDQHQILDIIQAEFSQNSQSETRIRYCQGARYIKKLVQYPAEEIAPLTVASEPLIKQNGVYLITGGAGGLGLIFASYLASTYKAKLILTGRSKLSSAQEVKLDEFKKQGAEVRYFQVDASKIAEVKNLIKEVKLEFGAINGIIHSAGVLRDSYIRNKTLEEMEAVFAPKMYGAIHLDSATEQEDLDFFVMFSSMAAVSGNMGQCDYSFANSFLDSFAAQREHLRSTGHRSGKTLSLNWSIWRDGGMKLDKQTEIYFKNNLGIRPLSSETGLTAFISALDLQESQLAVVEGVKDKIELAWGIRREEPLNPMDMAPDKLTVDHDLISIIQGTLSQIVTDFLKLDTDDISVDKILMDLGFDSIGLATFANTLNDTYKLDDITPVLFFEYPSIKDIARFLCEQHTNEVVQYHQITHTTENSSEQKSEPIQENSIKFKKGLKASTLTAIVNEYTDVAPLTKNRFLNMPIAIVGMSGVMPQADDLDEYWEKLKNAKNNMITLVPEDRWKWEDYYGDPFDGKNKTKIKWGGFMREIDKFDPSFWGISPREAAMMDPQQRIFLETVWKTIEDSGHKVSELSGTKTGIFVGAATKDYIDLMGSLEVELDGYSGTGTSHAVLANRVSYMLNLHGPSAPLDTACSSSLVALHRAIESIHTGSSDMAIVGGVQVILTPAGHISFGAAGMLSEDGKCKTFDERANGYVRGEGSGAIFIKPLWKAEEDGDHIYAVIKSTAENHGGKVTVLTAPNPGKQAELLIEAYEKAEIDPCTVGYIECHGTGTSLGDPIEIQALKKAFSELYKRHGKGAIVKPHIGLTSAKTNIGHLETAAGIAGVLKVLLSIKHKQIPALLHFQNINPYIKLEDTPFYIVDKTQHWETTYTNDGFPLPRRAGVSSFGFGGANVHIVLEEYLAAEIPSVINFKGPCLIVLSAKNEERLKVYAERMLDYAKTQEFDLINFAYTLQVGRDSMPVRLGFVARSKDQLIERLTAYVDDVWNDEEIYHGKATENKGNHVDNNTIDIWFSNRNDAELLKAWVNGLDLGWNKLYNYSKPRRISLPSYPFARESYWFKTLPSKRVKTPVDSTVPMLHPFVHRNTSDLSRQSYQSTFSGDEFFIKDHIHQNQKFLSPAVCLEMIRVAIDRATPTEQKSSILELRQVDCEDLIDMNLSRDVTVSLYVDDQERIGFEINCDNNDQQLIHCIGEAMFIDDQHPVAIPIQQLNRQMRQISREELSSKNSFDAITAIYRNDGQMLIELQIPDIWLTDQNDYVLHPSFAIDLIAIAVRLLTKNDEPVAAPLFPAIRLDALRIFSVCTKDMYAWLRFDTDGDRNYLDIDLSDKQGNICAQFRKLSISSVMNLDNQELSLAKKNTPSSNIPSKPRQVTLSTLQEISDPIPVEPRVQALSMPTSPFAFTPETIETTPSLQAESLVYTQTQLQAQLVESLAEALYLNSSDVEIDKSFMDLGLDSIVGVEWLNTINKRYKLAIAASVVYDYPTIKKLALFLYKEINNGLIEKQPV
jgi:polyketide synthase PksN